MWPFSRKSLLAHLHQTKTIRLEGVQFKIKKLSPMEYLEGSKVMLELFSTYKSKGQTTTIDENTIKTIEKTKTFLTDIIVGGVVSPRIVRNKDCLPTEVFIEELFNDFAFAQKLGEAILVHTYGKKK